MIKKYNQFIKETKTNEEFVEAAQPERAPSVPSREVETIPGRPETPTTPRPSRPSVVPTEKPGVEDAPLAELEEDEEPQEGNEYIGELKIKELVNALGPDAILNGNTVEYNGKEINFYSETEKFHVDRKKFETTEDVVEFLKGNEEVPVKTEKDFEDETMDPEFEAKSYRLSRKEKRIK
jgi:hypothetical protein